MAAVFDGTGKRAATFVHSGWIRNILPSRDGRYLLAGGISNAHQRRLLAVHAPREREGFLKHSRDACLFRDGPAVLEWMPEHGWRELKP